MIAISDERASHFSSKLVEKEARRYLTSFVWLPFLALVVPFVLERVDSLQHLGGSGFARVLDYSYENSGTNADVVLFGDSSALYGIDTDRLSSELGLKVIDLPGTMGSLPVTQELSIHRYLAHNRPPRLMVFYVAPWDLDVLNADNRLSYEGDEQMLRHANFSELANFMLRRPMDFVYFPIRFYSISSRLTALGGGKPYVEAKLVHGVATNTMKRALAADCVIPEPMRNMPSTASMVRLSKEYTSQTTKTLVYIAPIPDCKFARDIESRKYDIAVEPSGVLPAHYFSGDLFYAHFFAQYTSIPTDLLAPAIKKALDH